MKKSIITELKYQYYSKILLGIILSLIIAIGISLFLSCLQVINLHNTYLEEVKFYNESNLNIENSLKEEYTFDKDVENGLTTIDNPLKYYNEGVKKFVFVTGTKYMLSHILEAGTSIFFPIAFAILGIYVATYDIKFRTIKMKAVIIGKKNVNLSKQLSLLFSSLFIFVVVNSICFLLGYLFRLFVLSDFPFNEFSANFITKSFIFKILYSYFLCIFFAQLGFTLGYIFKTAFIPIISVLIYYLAIPSLGKYDLKNVLLYLHNKIFDYYGIIYTNKPYKISMFEAVVGIVLLIILSICLNYIIVSKRSSYNC